MSFDEDLDAALAAEVDWVTVDVSLNGVLRTFRFDRMDGQEYDALTNLYPPRLTATLDKFYGYNIHDVALACAPLSGRLVDGDTLVELSEDQWRKYFKGASGAAVGRIRDAIFNLNEYMPAQEVEAAKKAFAVESVKNLLSPAPSESPAAGSPDGSPDSSPDTSTTATGLSEPSPTGNPSSPARK
jgi:hypothetical protein